MTTQEWHRLRAYWDCQQAAKEHRPNVIAKRHAKGHAKGVGQLTLKTTRIIPGVGVERVFVNRPTQ